jgi:hypothetical protein
MIKIIEKNEINIDGCSTYEAKMFEDDKEIDGFYAGPLCESPEDAILERDLSYAYLAVEWFKKGYEAGKNNIEVKFEETFGEDE